MKFFIALTLALVAPICAQSQSVSLWLHVESSGTAQPWMARAVEGTVFQYLTGFERIKLREDFSTPPDCEDDSLGCILSAASEKSVETVLWGNLRDKTLHLKIYETSTRTLVSEKTVDFNNSNLNGLRHEVFQLIKPLINIGGLVDQKNDETEPLTESELVWQFFRGAMWAGIGILLFFLLRRYRKTFVRLRRRIPASTAAILSVCGAVFLIAVIANSISYHKIYKERMERAKQLVKEQKNG